MAAINLDRVVVDFPIYRGGDRSLRKLLFHLGSAGAVALDEGERITIRALDGVSLDLREGDRVGLVGTNGAGKTTLLRVLGGIYEPTTGEARIEGQVSTLLDLGLGVNPEFSGRENIIMRGLYMGLSQRQVRQYMEDIEAFTELGDYLSLPVRTYSAGMRLRLAFAAATCAHPEILLMDEWILAGDAQFLAKAQRRLEEFVAKSSILVLASHKLDLLKQWCNKLVLLNRGRIEMVGPPDAVIAEYRKLVPPPPPRLAAPASPAPANSAPGTTPR